MCNAKRESAFTNSRTKSRSPVASILFAVESSEIEIRSHGAAIQRSVAPATAPDPEGKDSLASGKSASRSASRRSISTLKPAANAPPARFSTLQVSGKQASRHFRPARHDSSQLRTIQQDRSQLINRRTHVLSGDQSRSVITAAATVQLVSSFTDPRHQVASQRSDARPPRCRLSENPVKWSVHLSAPALEGC